MFEQTFTDGKEKTTKPLSFVFSVLLEVAVLALLLVIPLVYTQVLPNAQLRNHIVAPAPPRAPRTVVSTPARTAARVFNLARLSTPVVIPKTINAANEATAVAPDIAIGSPNADAATTVNGIFGAMGSVPKPPPVTMPPPQPK